jgi:type I restriction enzyme S subunit
MAGEWEETTLADVSADVAYGYTQSASDEKVGPRFLRITDIQNGVVNWDTVPYCLISELDYRKYRLQSGDIVVARTGNSTGENYLYRQAEDAVYASYLIRFRINQRTADPAFVWYNMRTQRWQDFINSSKTGSAQAGANAKVLGLFSLTLPPLAEQRAIAGVLGALDDKIELNRRMNATLESMARALFQSWFVDFDPVRAKLDGRQPTGMDKDIAELFPAHFDHAAEGVAPTGWSLKRWGDVATLEYGKSIRHYRESSGEYRVFGTNGPIGFHDEALCNSEGIVIGRKGAYRGVHYSPCPFFVIDTAFYLKPKVTLDLKWAYYELMRFDINSMDSGSAIPSTSRDDFYGIPVIVPPPKIQAAFGEIVGGWYANAFANLHQSRTLASLRDTLLPKLLSGELSVAEASRNADITG